jgi:putative FmdB family regulatory protein
MSPLYHYNCKKCKKVYGLIIPMKYYDSVIPCPKCDKDMEKIIGMPAVQMCKRSVSDKRDFR